VKPEHIKRLSVVGLLLIFASPILISWWLLNFTDYSRSDAAASHGELIVPPRPLQNMSLVNPTQKAEKTYSLHGKWSLVYLITDVCDTDCGENLYKMRQLRLAAGEYAPRIQRVLVYTGKNVSPMNEEQMKNFPGQLLLSADQQGQLFSTKIFARMKDENPALKRRLYLVDPLGNLMMSYSAESDPAGIIKDLKRLLRYSRIG
jgi:cytochrome oxidase Cu insertion factor (SCO1/SenC/PrrC family)